MRSMRPCGCEAGFGATAGVLLLASGALAMSLAALGAALAYADSVYHEELRVQADMNNQACQDSISLIKSKDAFVSGTIDLPEFGCILHI